MVIPPFLTDSGNGMFSDTYGEQWRQQGGQWQYLTPGQNNDPNADFFSGPPTADQWTAADPNQRLAPVDLSGSPRWASYAAGVNADTGNTNTVLPQFKLDQIFNSSYGPSGTTINPYGSSQNRANVQAVGASWGLSPSAIDQLAIKNADTDFTSSNELFTTGTSWNIVDNQLLGAMSSASGHPFTGLSPDQYASSLDTAAHVQRNFNDTMRSREDAEDWQQGGYLIGGALTAVTSGLAAPAVDAATAGAETTATAANAAGTAGTAGADASMGSVAGGLADQTFSSAGTMTSLAKATVGAASMTSSEFTNNPTARIALGAASGAVNNASLGSNNSTNVNVSGNDSLTTGANSGEFNFNAFENGNPITNGSGINFDNIKLADAGTLTGVTNDASPTTQQGTPMGEGDVVNLGDSSTTTGAVNPLQGMDLSGLGIGSGAGAPGTNSLQSLIAGVSDPNSGTPQGDTGSSGNDLLKFTNDFLGGPKNVLSTGLQAYMYDQLSRNARANIAAQKQTSSLDQPQRAPWQAAAANLNTPEGAANFVQNNPEAAAINARFRDFVIPRNIAQSGNVGNVLDTQGSQYVGALAGLYSGQLNTDLMAGGFTSPPSGYVPASIGAQQNNQMIGNAGQVAALGRLLGTNYGAPASGTTGTGLFGTNFG